MRQRHIAIVFILVFCFISLTPLLVGQNIVYVDKKLPAIPNYMLSGIGTDTTDYVDQISNLHAPTDVGTHSAFANMQAGPDLTNDTLTEADTGGGGVNEWRYVDSYSDVSWAETGSPQYIDAPDDSNYITGTNGQLTGWSTFADTSGSGTDFTVNMSIYWYATGGDDYVQWEADWTGDGVADVSGSLTTHLTPAAWATVSLTGCDTATEINACTVRLTGNKGGAGPDSSIVDAVRLGISQAGGAVYDLDIEVGWTAVDFDETNEELCIFAGPQGAEALRVDVWDGAWTNIETDLAANQWNNYSITSYLTGSAFEIRFTDTTDDATTQDTWEIDVVLIHVWTTSYAPTNDQAPTFEDPTDTDFFYANYTTYEISANTTDQNGYADIDFINMSVWSNDQATNYFALTFDQDTTTYGEVDPSNFITLVTASCSVVEAGDSVDVTWAINIHWNMTDTLDVDLKQTVNDTQALSDSDTYEAFLGSIEGNFESRLDYSVAPAVTADDAGTVDRGDLDEAYTFEGTLIYYGSVDDYPNSNGVDVWLSQSAYGSNVGPWSDTTLTSGAFSITGYGDDIVAQTTATVKPVEEGAGSGGTSLYYTTDLTDTYIADQLTITITGPTDNRQNINANASGIVVSAVYDYGGTFDGTLTLNDTDYNGDGTVKIAYFTVSSASADTHGVTLIGTNDNTYMIWDQIIVLGYNSNSTDNHDNINDGVNITVWIQYDYDDTNVTDGTVTINGESFTYQSGGNWTAIFSNATASTATWNTLAATGNTYGITSVNQNGKSFTFIWDSLTITIAGPTDNRQNINANATGIIVSAVYDMGGSYDGTLTLNDTDYNGDGTVKIAYFTVSVANGDDSYEITAISTNDNTYMIWDALTCYVSPPTDQRINIGANASGMVIWAIYDYDSGAYDGTLQLNDTVYNHGTVGIYYYNVTTANGDDTYGISIIMNTGNQTYCVFDALTAYVATPNDQRINIGANCTGLIIWAIYEYDSGAYDGTLQLNDTTYDHGTVGIYYYNVTVANGDDTYGITLISNNGNNTYCIFDALTAYVALPSDQRININDNCTGLIIWAIYEYDSGAYDGTLQLNDTTYNHGVVEIYYYNVTVANGDDTYGISIISNNGNNTYCIFDALIAYVSTPNDSRINIGANSTGIEIWAIYDYDDTTYDGTMQLNDTTYDHGVVGIYYYNVTTANGDDTYGITVLQNTGNQSYTIFDALTAYVATPDDQRININANCTGLEIWAIYEYDSTSYDGTLQLNDTTYDHSAVDIYYYNVTIANGDDTYGITMISNNGNQTYCIFDSLTTYISPPTDQRQNLNANATGMIVWAEYDYDSTTYDGTLTLNNTDYDGDGTVIRWDYNVSTATGDDTYGISVIATFFNTTYHIWDRLVVDIQADDETVSDNVQVNFTITVTFEYDSTSCTTYTIMFDRNGTDWYVFTNANKSLANDTQASSIYQYNASTVQAESLYGITVFTTNLETVTWSVSANPPVNETTPTLQNPDDTNNMYARYKFYLITTNSSDPDGYTSIDCVFLLLYDDGRSTNYWTVLFNNTDNSFSIVNGSAYIVLTWSTNVSSGNWVNITWSIKIDWDHIDLTGVDAMVFTNDTTSNSDTDWYEVDWDVETRLDYSVAPSVDDNIGTIDRGTVDGIFYTSGTVIFYTSVDNYPLANETDVWISMSQYGSTAGPWSGDVDGSGQFNITCYGDDVYGQDTVTIKIVFQGEGSGGTDLYYTTSLTDTYISDSLTVYISPPTDQRNNINSNATGMIMWADYDYDSTSYDGVLVCNNTVFSYATVQIQYYKVASASGGDTHGVTTISTTFNTTYHIWDSLVCYVSPPTDQRNNINANATGMIIWANYSYDNTAYDGTLQLNNTVYDYATVQRQDYNVTVANGDDTYGITIITNAGNTTYHIWDKVIITAAWASDARTNVGEIEQPLFTAELAYDSHVVGSGDTLRANTSWYFVWDAGNSRWYYNFDNDGELGKMIWIVNIVQEVTYDITALDTQGLNAEIIWDALVAYVSPPMDQRINIGANASGMIIWANYSYDNTAYDGTLQLNDTVYNHGVVGVYYYNVTVANGDDTYGITVITNGGNQTYCIFDALIAYVSPPNDQRIDIGENATGMVIWANYSYDNTAYDGTLALNDTTYNYGTVGRRDYNVTVANGDDTYGISVVSNSGNQTYCIFDALIGYVSNPSDQRINIGANASGIVIWANYSYDNTIYDGTLQLNDTVYNHGVVGIYYYNITVANGDDTYGITILTNSGNQTYCIFDALIAYVSLPSDQRINIGANASGMIIWANYSYDTTAYDGTLQLNDTTYNYATVGIHYYNVTIANGDDSYGISIITNDGNQTYCIFDALNCYVSPPTDQRNNINSNATGMVIWANYSYDNTLYDGTLQLNNTVYSYATAQRQDYNVTVANGDDTYGITVITNAGNTTYHIWDSLTTYISPPTDQRNNINTNATGMVIWAIYDYDSTTYGGSLNINDTDYDRATAVRADYTVASANGDDSYGITSIATEGNTTYHIWDSLTVYVGPPTDNRQNINANASGIEVWAIRDYDTSSFDGTLTLNNTDYNGDGTVVRWDYNVSSASGGSFGITTISTYFNTTYHIWDQVLVLGYTTNSTDNRDNIGDYFNISVWIQYDYDDTNVTDGTVTINGQSLAYQSGGNWTANFMNSTVSNAIWNSLAATGNTYGITSINQNGKSQEVIWDRVVITIVADDPTPLNGQQANMTYAAGTTIEFDYDDTNVTIYVITVQRNLTAWYIFTNTNLTLFNDTQTDTIYNYTVVLLAGETTWGLTNFSTNVRTITWSAAANEVPVNVIGPTLQNPTDTDNLYARYMFYIITTNSSDADTYSDIHFILLLLWDNGQTTNYWTIAFAENTNTFSVVNGSTSVAISVTSSSYSKSGNWVNITWYIKIDFDHASLTDIDMRMFTNDTAGDSDIDWYESDWDIESRLDYTVSPTVDDNIGTIDRGTVDGTFYVSGTIIYYGSGDNYPLANETQVYITMTEYGTSAGPWNGDVDGSGAFNITCYGDDVYGLDTLTIKIVEQGEDQTGTELYYTTSPTDDYISDSLSVYISPPTDQRQNLNANATGMVVWGIYDYGGAFDGTLTVNNTDYDGDGTVAIWYYNISSASGGAHGVTSISGTNSTYMIWDKVLVLTTASTLLYMDFDETTTVNVTLKLDYDSHTVGSGDSVSLNGSAMTWSVDHWYYTIGPFSSAGKRIYVVTTASEVTYGITSLDTDSKLATMYVMVIVVVGYDTNSTDNRDNINDYFSVNATLYYSANHLHPSSVTLKAGTYVSGDLASFIAIDGDMYRVRGTTGTPSFNVWINFTVPSTTFASFSFYGRYNGTPQYVRIWIYNYTAADWLQIGQMLYSATLKWYNFTFTDVSHLVGPGNQVLFRFRQPNPGSALNMLMIDFMRMRSNTTAVTDGTVTINGKSFTHLGSGVWQHNITSAIVGDFTFDTAVVSGNTYGIEYVNQGNNTLTVIWDSLLCYVSPPSDQRQNINANATGMVIWAIYDYDDTAFDGTLSLNNTDYDGDSTVVIWYYTVNTANGDDTYVITSITSSNTTYHIWDALVVYISPPSDQRNNINANATGMLMWANYSYDDTTYDGTLVCNNTQFSYATAQRQDYKVASANGDDTYGISTIITTFNTTYHIWDSLTCYVSPPTDQRVNINANASGMVIWAIYDYDSTSYDGTLNMNNTDYDYATAQRQGYKVGSANGDDTYAITTISTTNETYCIWDSLVVYISPPTDNRQNLDANATGMVMWANYSYDNTLYDGTLVCNNTDFDGDGTAVRWDYKVGSANGDDTYGISTIVTTFNTTYMIWDSLTIVAYGPSDTRINTGTNMTAMIFNATYDYDSSLFDGTFTYNDTVYDHTTAGIYYYNATSANGDDTYGITKISTFDTAWCIFDNLTITAYGPTDQRININANASGMIFNATYAYDSTLFDGTLTLNDTTFDYGVVGIYYYTVSSASGDSYGITLIQTNDNTYCIFDALICYVSPPSDQRINIGANATGMIIWANYSYDITQYDGTIHLNDTTYNYGVVGIYGYNVTVADGDDTYGITVITNGGNQTYCIFDALVGYVSTPDDLRIDIGANSTGIVIWANYSYDNTLYDGTLQLNDTTYDYGVVGIYYYNVTTANGDDTYGITVLLNTGNQSYTIFDALIAYVAEPSDQRINIGDNCTGLIIWANYSYDNAAYDGTLHLNDTTYDHGTVGIYYYNVTIADGDDSYGITIITNGGNQTYCIFDALVAYVSPPTDQRIDINANATGMVIWANYSYDNTNYDGTLSLNDTTYNYGTVGIYYYNITVANGDDIYGITVITNSGNQTYCIFDALNCYVSLPNDQRNNINTNATGMVIWANYSYDNTVYDGTLQLNNTNYNYATAQRQDYNVTIANGDDSYGITIITNIGNTTYHIWDSLTITITGPTDNRQNLNANASGIVVSAIYDYDTSTFDGTLTLNNTDYNGDGTATIWYYTVNSASGGTYGITAISTNDDTYMIWDSITVYVSLPIDQRININTNASGMIIWGVYDYDSTSYDGTLTMNNTNYNYATAQRQGYEVGSANGDDTYGITTISSTYNSTFCIWDSLSCYVSPPTDQRNNINSNATGMIIWAIYDYDSSAYDGTLNMNNTDYSYATSQIQYYKVGTANGDDTYGITTINSANVTYHIWDRVIVTIVADDTTPQNDVTAWMNYTSGTTIIFEYDSTNVTVYTISVQRNLTAWFVFTNTNLTLFNDTNSNTIYNYTAITITGETTYGLTVISSNVITITWSAISADPISIVVSEFTNLDDTNNMYGGRYRNYIVIVNISHDGGYTNLVNISIWVQLESGAEMLFGLLYDNATDVFSEYVGATYIYLVIAESSASRSGNWINATFVFAIEWVCPDTDGLRLNTTAYDDSSNVNSTLPVNTYDVDTDLTLVDEVLFEFEEYTMGQAFGTIAVTYAYEDSNGDNYPLASQTDFWITRPEVSVEGISERNYQADSYDEGTGRAYWLSINAVSQGSTHQQLWTIFAVAQGEGSGGVNLMGSPYTDLVIIRAVVVTPEEPQPPIITTPIVMPFYAIFCAAVIVYIYYQEYYDEEEDEIDRFTKRRKIRAQKKWDWPSYSQMEKMKERSKIRAKSDGASRIDELRDRRSSRRKKRRKGRR